MMWNGINVERYKKCIVRNLARQFSVTLEQAEDLMKHSGVEELIDNNPMMCVTFSPDEWEENVAEHIFRIEGRHNGDLNHQDVSIDLDHYKAIGNLRFADKLKCTSFNPACFNSNPKYQDRDR